MQKFKAIFKIGIALTFIPPLLCIMAVGAFIVYICIQTLFN